MVIILTLSIFIPSLLAIAAFNESVDPQKATDEAIAYRQKAKEKYDQTITTSSEKIKQTQQIQQTQQIDNIKPALKVISKENVSSGVRAKDIFLGIGAIVIAIIMSLFLIYNKKEKRNV